MAWDPFATVFPHTNLSHAPLRWAEGGGYAFDGVPLLVRPQKRTPRAPRPSTVCLLPKAGSTFLKAHLAFAILPTVGGGCNTVHCSRLSYPLPSPADALRFETTPAFIVVRHPVPRLLSAFLCARANVAVRASARALLRGSRNATFSEFVAAVTAVAPASSLNPHFRLQTQQCGWQDAAVRARYKVLKLEHARHWIRSLLTVWWGLPWTAEQQRRVRNATGSAVADALVTTHYTPTLLDTVEAWARADVRAFGYAPWPRTSC